LVARERKTLVVAGVPVATLGGDPTKLNPLSATSAEGMPVVEILAAIASQHPTGVLALEGPRPAEQGFAFAIDNGRVVGARGPGSLDQLEPWIAEVHRRFPERFEAQRPGEPVWMGVARDFVTERVLDHLELTRKPGARMTFLRGDVAWIGTTIPKDRAPTLEHLLLEHARRWDELPSVLAKLGELDRTAVPLSQPADRPRKEPEPLSNDDGWDFFDDPDPAAMEEWQDACAVWQLCDGETIARDLVDAVMLGRFRGLAALHTLINQRHVCLIDVVPPSREITIDNHDSHSNVPLSDDGMAPVISLPSATPAPAPPEPRQKAPSGTEYSLVSKSSRMLRTDQFVTKVAAQRSPARRGPSSTHIPAITRPQADPPFATGPRARHRTSEVPQAGGSMSQAPRPFEDRPGGEPIAIDHTEPPAEIEIEAGLAPAELSNTNLRVPADASSAIGRTKKARTRAMAWVIAGVTVVGLLAAAAAFTLQSSRSVATDSTHSSLER
jgi:hypothetical protein